MTWFRPDTPIPVARRSGRNPTRPPAHRAEQYRVRRFSVNRPSKSRAVRGETGITVSSGSRAPTGPSLTAPRELNRLHLVGPVWPFFRSWRAFMMASWRAGLMKNAPNLSRAATPRRRGRMINLRAETRGVEAVAALETPSSGPFTGVKSPFLARIVGQKCVTGPIRPQSQGQGAPGGSRLARPAIAENPSTWACARRRECQPMCVASLAWRSYRSA